MTRQRPPVGRPIAAPLRNEGDRSSASPGQRARSRTPGGTSGLNHGWLAAAAVALVSGWMACVPVRAGEMAGVPETGPLTLDQLIQLALANDPELAELRGEIGIARAKERAAKDWRDPEIRFQWQRDNDVELPPEEIETITSTTSENISESRSDSSQQGDGDSSRTRSNASIRRETTETTTRTIDRGGRSDRIVEETTESTREYERRTESGTETRRGTPVPTSERLVRQSNERVVGRTVEERDYNLNRLTPDEDFSVALRLYVPNPWEQRAKVAAARAETHRLEALLRAAEHEIVLDVREAYAKLKERDAEITETQGLAKLKRRFVDDQEELESRAKPEDLIDAQGEYFELEFELDALRLEFDEAAMDIAALVGLPDPSRISLSSSLAPRDLDLSGLDRQFLHQMAELYRGDLVDLIHRAQVSKLELKEYNAQKIPWFSFVQGFYGVEYDRGYRQSDNYGVQFSMTLPLFSWFKNKEGEVFEEEIRSYNQQASVARVRIQAEVDAALNSFQKARQRLAAFDKVYAKSQDLRLQKIKELDELGIRFKDAKDVAEESLAEWRVRRVKVYALYNEALLRLERALGADLAQVFSATPAAEAKNPVAEPVAEPQS